MNTNTILSDSFKNTELFDISFKIKKLRKCIDGGHLISIDSDFGNIINDIDEKTSDDIIDDIINSSENNQTVSELDDSQTEQIPETTDKNSFSITDISIEPDISQFLDTETEHITSNNNFKKYKISK